MVKKLPSCYGRTAAPVAKRCARVNMSGNNVEAPWYGELVLGQSVELPCAMTPVQTTYTDYRTMIPRPLGGVAARGRSAWPHRTKSLVFQHPDTPTTAESGYWAAWEAEFIIRSLGGAPMLLVPSTDRSEVLYGHCQPSISESDGSPGQAGYRRVDAVQIVDQALPVQL